MSCMEGILQVDPSKRYSRIQILSLIHNLYLAPQSIWIFSLLAANIIWLLVITRLPGHSGFIWVNWNWKKIPHCKQLFHIFIWSILK